MMSFTASDHRYMARAIQLAERGLYTTDPNPRVGCVIVQGEQVIGEGWHEVAGGPHAEIHALRQAGEAARDASMYVSLEPCCHTGKTPPCTEAVIAAGIGRVVVAMQDPNPQVAGNGLKRLREAGLQVELGLLETQAMALNPGFIKRMQRQRPFVRNKLAMSLDGRTAMADGESKWITGEAARRDVQHLRARSSAIMTGIGTVLADDPSLNVRLPDAQRQPLRVVMDTNLSMPLTAKLLGQAGQTLVMTANSDSDLQQRLQQAGAEVVQVGTANGRLDLPLVMQELAQRQVNEVLLETGATLSGAMLAAGLIDELVVYMAPVLLGDAARGLFRLPHLQQMADRIALDIQDVRAVGNDLRITATPIY